MTTEPIKDDDIVWVRWEDSYGYAERRRGPPVETVTRPPEDRDWVRGRVLEILPGSDPARPWSLWLLVALGTGVEHTVRAGDFMPLDSAVEVLAHANGCCVFCLDTGRLVSRNKTITVRCDACRPKIDLSGLTFAVTRTTTIRTETIANGGAVTMTWSMTTQAEAGPSFEEPALVRRGWRSPPRGRCRLPVSREEAARRRSRMLEHGRRR